MYAFFRDEDVNFEVLCLLGGAAYQAVDVGEVLAAIDGLKHGDDAGWVAAMRAQGERLQAEADAAHADGHARTAAQASLRAASFLAAAMLHADGTGDPDLFGQLYEAHRASWDAYVARSTSPRIEPIAIPYEGTTLDGWFFHAADDDAPRRTFVFNNGSDGAVTSAWVQGIGEAVARGWNGVTFDGPGQSSTLVRKHLGFRADWEHVVTPVVDHLLTRSDVDPARLALLGVSQAGYWVPRSLAFEHRFAAAVADPGVVDVSTTLTSHLTHGMHKLLDEGDKEKFDRDMATGERFSKKLRTMTALRFRPYQQDSAFDVFKEAQAMALTDELIGQITTPLLVTSPEGEQFWPGQSESLYDRLPGTKALLTFTDAEGAGLHCEPVGNLVRNHRIFDWLDDQVPA